MTQLPLRFDTLTLAELEALVSAGLVVKVGQTADGKVASFALTAAGRILMNRHR